MTTSRTALGGLLALALAPAFCPDGAAAHTCDDPFSADLIAGRTIDAGDVKVCNDATTLTVTYEATYPWCLLETHLHVATVPDPPADPDANIPQNKAGNPIPGHFAYGDDYGGCLDGRATFEISLDQIDGGVGPGDIVVTAAHAKVEDDTGREESAWGEGARFVARGNWAMYFTYAVQPPPVTCPQACVAGLEALASRVAQGPLLGCHFDTDRQAGEVEAVYGSPAIVIASVVVGSGHCSAFIREVPEELVNIELTDAEQAACAPLAIDILPGVDETNCDISPP